MCLECHRRSAFFSLGMAMQAEKGFYEPIFDYCFRNDNVMINGEALRFSPTHPPQKPTLPRRSLRQKVFNCFGWDA